MAVEVNKKNFISILDGLLQSFNSGEERTDFLIWTISHIEQVINQELIKNEPTAVTSTPSYPPLDLTASSLPPICGCEVDIASVIVDQGPVFQPRSNISLDTVRAGFSMALHMHQPTIPSHSGLVSNLQHMMDNQGEGDNHNAPVFASCYGRLGDLIPQIVSCGGNPRIMLDYSGNLLWGLQQMGRDDILDKLKVLHSSQYQHCVEWLGTMWSHAVVPSTPIPDLKLHMVAWQHQFAAIFGLEALARVKGFSPPEMHLPNHPDVLYQYVKALLECGYRWLLVQEDSVERLDGEKLSRDDKYIPNTLVATNSRGETKEITVLVKTQGSDTKLVAQMQPFHEAKTRGRQRVGAIEVPCCVTQIADGENGGVMMNEFPRDFVPLWEKVKDGKDVVGFNGTEYIELLEAAGVKKKDYPQCQARGQHRIWSKAEQVNPDAVERAIEELKEEDHAFSVEGASWTNDKSWVKGYSNVLGPINQLSSEFHRVFDSAAEGNESIRKSDEYKTALLYNLLVQTSCFRYWGQGTWVDYAKELYSRGQASLTKAEAKLEEESL